MGVLLWRGFAIDDAMAQCFGNENDGSGKGRQMPVVRLPSPCPLGPSHILLVPATNISRFRMAGNSISDLQNITSTPFLHHLLLRYLKLLA
jgi:hypothetical protein